jgi:hypothetical protein
MGALGARKSSGFTMIARNRLCALCEDWAGPGSMELYTKKQQRLHAKKVVVGIWRKKYDSQNLHALNLLIVVFFFRIWVAIASFFYLKNILLFSVAAEKTD